MFSNFKDRLWLLLEYLKDCISGDYRDKTLAIIKPDAVKQNRVSKIIDALLDEGFSVEELDMFQLTERQVKEFYAEHSSRPFFKDLVEFMTSGPCVFLVLSHPGDPKNVIVRYRDLMGSTDPEEAAEGTLRKRFATSRSRNAVHGSDSKASARREIKLYEKFSENF
jgi:nucleoside-diphosphate kinase